MPYTCWSTPQKITIVRLISREIWHIEFYICSALLATVCQRGDFSAKNHFSPQEVGFNLKSSLLDVEKTEKSFKTHTKTLGLILLLKFQIFRNFATVRHTKNIFWY